MSEMEKVIIFYLKSMEPNILCFFRKTQTDELCSMTPGIFIKKGNGLDFDAVFTLKQGQFSWYSTWSLFQGEVKWLSLQWNQKYC